MYDFSVKPTNECIMQKDHIKPYLIERLKQEHCLWSYNQDSIKDMHEDVLVELVLLYLDIDDINLLFHMLPYATVKRAWLENVVTQGERYYQMNVFYAWYYFHAKRPQSYVKALATKLLNRRLSA